MVKAIEIVETKDTLTLRVNGVLLYNYHGYTLEALRSTYGNNALIAMMFQPELDGGYNPLFYMLLDQLRSEGYFSENR